MPGCCRYHPSILGRTTMPAKPEWRESANHAAGLRASDVSDTVDDINPALPVIRKKTTIIPIVSGLWSNAGLISAAAC